MMFTLSRYIIRSIAVPFLTVLAILIMALSLERMLRLFEEVSTYGASFLHVFELLLYLLPHYLVLALPAALFVGVLMTFRRLHRNAELDALQASGVSLRRLVVPVMAFSCVVMMLVLFLSSYAQPHTRYMFRDTIHSLKEAPAELEPRPGVFLTLGKNVTLRADRVLPQSKTMIGFFATVDLKNGDKTYLSAESAQLVEQDGSSEVKIFLKKGRQVRYDSEGNNRQVLEFEQYPWTLDLDVPAYGPRGQDERELTLRELILNKVNNLSSSDPRNARTTVQAELHARLVHAFSLPFLALLAVPLALMGRGRTGKATGFVVGMVLLVLYEKILGFGEAFVVSGQASPFTALWLPLFVLSVMSIAFFMIKAEKA